LKEVALLIIAVLVVVELGHSAYINRTRLSYPFKIWKQFSTGLFFQVLGMLATAYLIVILLWTFPPMRWGWYSLVSSDGDSGNFLVAAGEDYLAPILLLGFFVLLLFFIPFLAEFEEQTFRKGRNDLLESIPTSITFGLVHMLMGIPLAAAIAIMWIGFAYAWKYCRSYDRSMERNNRMYYLDSWRIAEEEGVNASTVMHTMSNSLLILTLLGSAVLSF
jgi:hypothetical protein